MSSEYSIVMYHGEFGKSRCGYCKKENTCNSHGMTAHFMSVQDYQDLIDRGWRRSGTFCYKPTNSTTCCPSYTIKCDTVNFKMSKSHKKIIKRMNKFLRDGINESSEKESNHEEEEGETPSEAHIAPPSLPRLDRNIDVSRIVNNLPQREDNTGSEGSSREIPCQVKESVDSAIKNSGPDSAKPPCKKAKLLRLERKQAKIAEREAAGISQTQVKSSAKNVEKSLEDFLNEQPTDGKHKLKVKLVPSSKGATQEALALYQKYQRAVHRDPPSKNTLESYVRFLCRSPLQIKIVPVKSRDFQSSLQAEYELYVKYQTVVHSSPPEDLDEFQDFLQHSPLQLKVNSATPAKGFGSFHQQYWLDNRLIAVGVIDILPNCVSSVYLFYDPDYSFLSLGTYSSLREIAFTRELQKTCSDLKYYYMGYYIHSCPKMRYKGKLQPSYLLCPEVYSWHLIDDDLLTRLNQSKYTRFNENDDAKDRDEFQPRNLGSVICLYDNSIMYFDDFNNTHGGDEERRLTLEYGQLVGRTCSKRILLYKN